MYVALGTKDTVPSELALYVPSVGIDIDVLPVAAATAVVPNKIEVLFIVPFPSGSVSVVTPVVFPAITGIITVTSLGVVVKSFVATGASFTAVTVIT